MAEWTKIIHPCTGADEEFKTKKDEVSKDIIVEFKSCEPRLIISHTIKWNYDVQSDLSIAVAALLRERYINEHPEFEEGPDVGDVDL